MAIKFAKSRKPANFPFLVQVQNTENWNTQHALLTKDDAFHIARLLAAKHPKLPVRVLHCCGGPIEATK